MSSVDLSIEGTEERRRHRDELEGGGKGESDRSNLFEFESTGEEAFILVFLDLQLKYLALGGERNSKGRATDPLEMVELLFPFIWHLNELGGSEGSWAD